MKSTPDIFGPVLSRRLGFSLGLDIIPFKTCSLDCVYCQLGTTASFTVRRRPFVKAEELLSAVAARLSRGDEIDWITFSGSGEPTLNSELGNMIRGIKAITPIPVAVITNSTLLDRPGVRKEIAAADLVVPSLDAGTKEVFQKINRPYSNLTLEKITRALADLTREGGCRVWLEVMLVPGINTKEGELEAIAERIKLIGPEMVQLNTPVRPPAEAGIKALSPARLEKAAVFLAERVAPIPVEVIGSARRPARHQGELSASSSELAEFLQRRPATLDELEVVTGRNRAELLKRLASLMESGLVVARFKGKKRYFAWRRPGKDSVIRDR